MSQVTIANAGITSIRAPGSDPGITRQCCLRSRLKMTADPHTGEINLKPIPKTDSRELLMSFVN
jgi:hypothetical protein